MSDYVPDCLIPEILCRLPVESLLRFRCVCKQWCCLISSVDFINTHLSHSLSATSLLHIRHYFTTSTPPKNDRYTIYLDHPSNAENLTLVKKLSIPFKSTRSDSMCALTTVGFCNGLFCLTDHLLGETYNVTLWNPSIRKTLSLPMPHFRFGPDARGYFFHGFGVDPKTHDFKVVRISYVSYIFMPVAVEVYSLSTGYWKTVNSYDIHCQILLNVFISHDICLNGTLHWISYIGDRNTLLLFDLSTETFSEMGLPLALLHVAPLNLLVTLCGEQLSVVWFDRDISNGIWCHRCVVWVMNQYGEPESWTEKFVVVLESEISHALGFRDNGEFLLQSDDLGLLSYDPESKEFKHVDIHGERCPFWLSKYVESLVLLDGSSGATADPPEDVSDSDEPTDPSEGAYESDEPTDSSEDAYDSDEPTGAQT